MYMEITRTSCVICNAVLEDLLTLPHFPIKLTCDIEPKFGNADLSYAKCKRCNCIQLDKLIPLPILYSDSHNYTSVGNVWNNFFSHFTNIIKPHVSNKTILEIGCPSGKLALYFTDAKTWYIVEPNKKNIEFPPNIIFIEQFFDDSLEINDNIDIIINSHLFEHIYEPRAFLKKCHSLLNQNGKMIFAIPNMQHIAKHTLAPCNGVFFEHTVFYNDHNVSYLLKSCGFSNINISYFENHSIIFYCEKNMVIESPILPNIDDNNITLFHKSIQYYQDFTSQCEEFFKNKNNNGTAIYIFGASYNSLFLWYFLQNKNIIINGIFDNNTDKQGKYLYGTNLMIYSPSIINNITNICVILKNGYYSNEIKTQLKTIKHDIHIIE